MEETCFKDCPLWKQFGKECPNFIESGWKDEKTGQVKIVKDCAPRRTMLMLQELFNRIVSLEKASNQARNSADNLVNGVCDLITAVVDHQQRKVVNVRPLQKISGS